MTTTQHANASAPVHAAPPQPIPVDIKEVHRKIDKAKSLLILDHPFFGAAVSRRDIIFTDSVPTAAMAATGQMYINPAFIQNPTGETDPTQVTPLTVKQCIFLLAHEAMHFMLMHATRRQYRDPKAWNIAADKVINDTLEDARVGDIIEGGVFMRGARDYAAEELYDDNDADGDGPGGIGCDIGNPCDADGNALDEAQIHQLEAQTKVETLQAAKAAKAMGKLPASLERMIDEIVKVTTPWHTKLERLMTARVRDGVSWKRPNRRFIANNMYLPGPDTKPKIGTVVIGADSSGSVSDQEYAMFGGHLNRILETCHPEKVILIHCDAVVAHVEEFTSDDLPIKIVRHGGGGTAFKPVFDYIDEQGIEPEVVIYLTDGYGDQNSFTTHHDTIWVTTGSEAFDWGEVLKYEDDQ